MYTFIDDCTIFSFCWYKSFFLKMKNMRRINIESVSWETIFRCWRIFLGGMMCVIYRAQWGKCHTETVDNNKNSCIVCDKMWLFINKFLRINSYVLPPSIFFFLICRTVHRRSIDSRSEEKCNARLLMCANNLVDRLSMNAIYVETCRLRIINWVVLPGEV